MYQATRTSVFTRPNDNKRMAFSKRSTLESGFKTLGFFGNRKCRLGVDAKQKRIKNDAPSERSGYVWTGPIVQCYISHIFCDSEFKINKCFFAL